MPNITPMIQEELAELDSRQQAALPWWTLSAEELARAYAAGRRNFNRANLDGANLDGANLDGANLDGANLRGANLRGANLRGADLYGANLRGADLYGADLYGADLREANLYGADLCEANLRGADLLNAPGLYVAYSPFLSSRGAALLGGIVLEDDAIQLRFWAGCKRRVAAEALRGYVRASHGEGDEANIHALHYEAAITFIEASFAIDMAAGKWDYLT